MKDECRIPAFPIQPFRIHPFPFHPLVFVADSVSGHSAFCALTCASCALCTTNVQDRRFREDASLLRLCPEAIWVLKTVVKCPPPATLESGSSRDSIRVHLRSSAVTSSLVAASEAALWPQWLCLCRFQAGRGRRGGAGGIGS